MIKFFNLRGTKFCNSEQKRHCDQNCFGRFKFLANYFFNVSGSGKDSRSCTSYIRLIKHSVCHRKH